MSEKGVVLRRKGLGIQIFMPADWTDQKAVELANDHYPEGRWHVRTDPKLLEGQPFDGAVRTPSLHTHYAGCLSKRSGSYVMELRQRIAYHLQAITDEIAGNTLSEFTPRGQLRRATPFEVEVCVAAAWSDRQVEMFMDDLYPPPPTTIGTFAGCRPTTRFGSPVSTAATAFT